jgi:CII-binding regulator of phage lambda lysogenization HflD
MIYVFIAELHLGIIHKSTDFYVLYFTSYLVILQKLFESELKEYNSQRIIFTEKLLAEIKFKLDSIQSLIERISNLLSPMLLFICGAIFYDLVSCLYFTITSIGTSAFLKSEYLTANIGLFLNLLRLICICFFAERLVFQVLLKYFF